MFFTLVVSCLSACLSVCVCVCVCVHGNGSIHLQLEHIVAYENSSDEISIGHCPIKVKVHLPQYKLSNPLSQLYTINT